MLSIFLFTGIVRSAIPAHTFSPLDTTDLNLGYRTILLKNDTIVKSVIPDQIYIKLLKNIIFFIKTLRK